MARIIIAPILVLFLFIACSVRSACYKIEKLVVKCPILCIGGVLEPFEGPAALIVGQRAFLPYAVLLEIGHIVAQLVSASVAGSGKTTVLLELLKFAPHLPVSYNPSNQAHP